MKIVHVVEAFGGGVFQSVSQLIKLFSDEHEVVLIYSRRDETPDDISAFFPESVQLIEMRLSRGINPVSDFLGLLRLVRLLRVISPDLIHLHSSKAGFLGRVAARLCGVSDLTIYSPRGLAFEQVTLRAWKRRLYLYLEKVGAAFGGEVVACSGSELAAVREKLGATKSSLIENAIDTSLLPDPAISNKPPGFVVVSSGRFCEQKNPYAFLELAKRLKPLDIRFRWIGGGDEVTTKAFEAHGVEVTGWVSREEGFSFLQGADIYIQTSLWEGMPLSVIEAQCLGVPAIVTDAIGNRDVVIDAVTGYVASSLDELESQLMRLYRNDEERKTFALAARELSLSRFCLDRMYQEYRITYDKSSRLSG